MFILRAVLSLSILGTTMSALAADQEEAIKRGAYLATAGDCSGCHTREGGKDYSGGLAIESPLGTLYSANITPDSENGIGDWSLEEFKRTLRQGLGKEGEYIYPAMPYVAYTKISDDDISDLWAYFKSLDPVKYDPPDNEMMFPANIRFGLALWQASEFKPGRLEPDPEKDDVYNRGAYLVEALGHCSSCHTPRNLLLGQKEDERYTGAEIHGWYAPNIGPGPLSVISDWSVDELATFLATGSNDENQKAVGEMANVIHLSLSQLTPEDLTAMATYLKEMPAMDDSVTDVDNSEEINNPRAQVGRALYAENCLSCHQADGKGIEDAVPSLVGSSAATAEVGNNIVMMMLEGHAPDGTWGQMPSFASTLSGRDMADVANYVRMAWGNQTSPNVTVDLVHSLREAADIPDGGQQAAVDCPIVTGALMEPTLDMTLAEFENALTSKSNATNLVQTYWTTLESTDNSDLADTENTVLALTSAYCRALAEGGKISNAEQMGRVAALAGRLATVATTN